MLRVLVLTQPPGGSVLEGGEEHGEPQKVPSVIDLQTTTFLVSRNRFINADPHLHLQQLRNQTDVVLNIQEVWYLCEDFQSGHLIRQRTSNILLSSTQPINYGGSLYLERRGGEWRRGDKRGGEEETEKGRGEERRERKGRERDAFVPSIVVKQRALSGSRYHALHADSHLLTRVTLRAGNKTLMGSREKYNHEMKRTKPDGRLMHFRSR